MGNNRLWKKVLVYLMTFMMIFSTMPTSVFADTEQNTTQETPNNSEQIGAYYEVDDGDGKIPDSPTLSAGSTEQVYEEGAVKLNKTIEPTNEENVFKITLEATTTESIKEIKYKPDSAVVIVVDCSFSMHACNACQHRHDPDDNSYTGDCKEDDCDCTGSTLIAAGKRYNAAWKATQAFINRYVQDADGAYRKIAIVKFSGYKNRSVDGAETVVPWTNASDLDTTGNNIDSKISDNLIPDGGTNLQAGLQLADNLLKAGNVPKGRNGKDIKNKSVVVISDGAPTYHIVEDSDEAKIESTVEICPNSKGLDGGGNSTDHTTHTLTEKQAKLLKSNVGDVFAVYVGNEGVDCTSDDCNMNMTGEAWLRNKCLFQTESANNADSLVQALETFMGIIESKNQAWQVTDPMGQHNEYVDANRPTVTPGEFTQSLGTLSWNLKDAKAITKTEGNTTYHTYTLSYNIKLDNLAENFPEGYIPANGVTDLNYVVTQHLDGDQIKYKEDTGYFNIPSVKGLVGEYEFNKVDDSGKPVKNAKFTITHTCDTCSYCSDTPCEICKGDSEAACERAVPEDIAIATSDANGKVKFSNIPSGHTYTLRETTIPNGYEMPEGAPESYSMTVSYGEVTVNGSTAPISVVNNKLPIVNVEGEKTWIKEGTGSNPAFQIALYGEYVKNGTKYYLYNNNNIIDSSTMQRAYGTSSNNSWSWTNLPEVYDGEVVNWYIKETTVPNGYTPVVDGWNVTNIQESSKDYIGQKIWVGDEVSDRPSRENMDIALYKNVNGQEVLVSDDIKWVETEGGIWIFKFENIPGRDESGNIIEYYAKERTVPAGYVHTRPDMVTVTPSVDSGVTGTKANLTNSVNTNNNTTFETVDGEIAIVVGERRSRYSESYDIWTSEALNNTQKTLVIAMVKKVYGDISSSNTTFQSGNNVSFSRGYSYNESDRSVSIENSTSNKQVTVDFSKVNDNGNVWERWFNGSFVFENGAKLGSTTLTNEIKTEDVTVKKSWNDNNDKAGMRPESIVVTLTGTTGTGNSVETIVTEDVTLSESNNWEYKWTGLRDYKNGKDVVYTVKEKGTSNYYVTSGPVMNEDGDYVITNTFTPDPTVPVEISGNKTLTGRQMKSSDSFTFNIEGADEATKAAITAGDITGLNPVTINGTEGATDKVFTFSGITFKKAGEYNFNITESEGSIPGVNYDNSVVTVTVNVAYSKEDGRLKATVTYPENSGVQFTNEYSAKPAEITLDVSKTLTGRDWINADEFTFELKALKDGNAESITLPDPVTITKATDKHKATFGKLVFDKEGTYKFVVTEIEKSGDGITYDKSEKIVTVVVNDNGNGKLTAAVDADHSDVVAFTNIYDPEDVRVQLNGTKQLEGATLTAGAFEFSITAVTEGAPMPASGKVTNDAEGVVNFGDIVFSKAGTYVYEITEIAGKAANVKYDGGKVTATVTVTENKENGTLSASVTYSKNDGEVSDSFVFKNEYYADAKPISLVATKSLGGVSYGKTPEFTFVLTPAESNADTDPISEPVEVKLNGAGTVTLVDKVTYTEPGTYVYTVSERQGHIPNMTYDTQPIEITVVVTENKTAHELDTEVTYKKNNETVGGIAFANTYSPEGTDAIIGGFKTVSGNKQLDNERFKFTIEAVTPNAPLPEESTVENNSAGEFQFQFGRIEYTEPGVYEYQVTEVQKATASEMPGYTYDDNVYTVIVTITDENGKLVSDVEYKDDDETVNGMYFDNVYRPETVKESVEGSKVMVGRDLKDGESYEFRIAAITSGAPLPADTTVSSGNDGTFEFGDITFDKAGRYEYSITEVDGTTPGVEYSTEVYKAVIVVRDNIAEGKLEIESVKYFANDEEVNEVVFTNEYKPAAIKAVLRGDKTLKGRAMAQGESFDFTMEAADRSTRKAIDNKVITGFDGTASVSGGAKGEAVAFDFGEMTFTAAGEYRFTITENIPAETNGITYDESIYTVTIEVTDNEERGSLEAVVTYGKNGSREEQASFRNTYAYTPVQLEGDTFLKVKKNFMGREWTGNDAFTFKLKTNDDATRIAVNNGDIVMPDNSSGITIDKNTNGYEAAFGNIEFKTEGSYEFLITELIPEDIDTEGISYDSKEYVIEVNVVDNKAGQLVADVVDRNDVFEFTNTYSAKPVTVEFGPTKILTGREWLDSDAFTFELKPYNPTTGEDVNADDSVTINNAAENHKKFKKLTFDEPGVYQYKVSEVIPENTNGITYDGDIDRVVTITVTDNGTGELVADVAYDTVNELTFTNSYSVTSTTAPISGTKVMDGRALDAGKFTFNIVAESTTAAGLTAETMPMPANAEVKNNETGVIDFGSINFTKAGKYVYKITEKKGNLENVTYDEGIVTATVTVTEDVDTGTLTASVKYSKNTEAEPAASNSFTFTNKYVADSDEVPFTATKVLSGDYGLEEGLFSFTLSPVVAEGGSAVSGDPITEPVTVTNAADGTVDFGDFVFTEPGTYVYSASEIQPDPGVPGIIYDNYPVEITVVVTEQGNKLVANVTYIKNGEEVDSIVFNNAYHPAATTAIIGGQKSVSGNKNLTNEVFTFKIESVDTNVAGLDKDTMPIPNPTTVNNKQGEFVFEYGNITYTKPGEYVYKVTEVPKKDENEKPGYTYDGKEYTVTVTITDNKETGELESTVVYSINGEAVENNQMTFDNIYDPVDASVVLEGKKELTGYDRTLNEGEFTFYLLQGDEVVGQATNNADGTFSFEEIEYSATGTYTYTIVENVPSNKLPGMEYSNVVYTAVVEVTDSGFDGELDATVTYYKDNSKVGQAVFRNEYTPVPANVVILGQKTLEGRDWKQSDEFGFTLEGANAKAKEVLNNNIKTAVATSGDDEHAGEFKFEKIVFTEEGKYEFNVKETAGEIGGIHYDSHTSKVIVTVTHDESTGKLEASVVYDKDTNKAAFVNSYEAAPVEAKLEVSKVLDRAWQDGDEFEFVLDTVSDADYGNAVDMPLFKRTNIKDDTEEKTAEFNPIKFKEAGTYNFIITEKAGNLPGVTYDKSVWTATVEVIDNGEGELVVSSIEYTVAGNNDSAEIAEFTNTYTAEPVEAQIEAVKELTGRDLRKGEFSFELIDSEDKVIQTKTNAADGTVSFDKITYDEPGEYVYTVTEKAESLPGVTYDESDWIVTVEVTDNGEGQLEAEVTYEKDGSEAVTAPTEFEFVNTYKADDTEPVEITANKEVSSNTGNEYKMEGGDFIFELVPGSNNPADDPIADRLVEGENGVKKATTTNDADGVIEIFNDAVYKHAGTYTYSLFEVNSGAAGFGYSDKKYLIEVEVVDDTAEAKLKATVTFTDITDPEEYKSVETLTYVNMYDPSAAAALIYGHKTVEPAEGNSYEMAGREFTFKLTGKNDAPMPEVDTAVNDKNGVFNFGEIIYITAGTYEYTITEIAADQQGMIYSEQSYDVEVVVSDDNEGRLSAVVNGITDSEGNTIVSFVNNYDPIDAELTIKALKKLNGRELNAEEFSFELEDADGNVISAKNAEDGTVTFDEITYDRPGIYTYTVSEVVPEDMGSIIYTDKEYEVTVTVEDKEGKLEAVAKVEGEVIDSPDDITFVNTYETTELTVYKNWKDKHDKYDTRPEEITVYLEADGEIVQTVQITEADKWRYTFSELPVYADGEEIVYTISEEPVDGYITEVNDMVITNTIDPDELDKFADTGDDSKPWAYGFAGLMAMITAAGTLFIRRRED